MNTILPPTCRSGFRNASELLLLLLFVVSMWQIALCLSASGQLLKPLHSEAVLAGPVLGTNAPASGAHVSPPLSQTVGFPSGAKRG